MKKFRLPLIILAVLFAATAVLATAAHMSTFNSTYKPKAGSALAKAGCSICHIAGDFKKLNPYGTALKGKGTDVKALRAVEKLDSDKDGVTNINEIKAGTLPGDPKSKPAASKKPSKKGSCCPH